MNFIMKIYSIKKILIMTKIFYLKKYILLMKLLMNIIVEIFQLIMIMILI